ncbi:hypothetical protein DL767_010455 [Monosporascus sp. MG133]|nr:hypothetical protein DL767_010455 [Monosporascus sp. MG133]
MYSRFITAPLGAHNSWAILTTVFAGLIFIWKILRQMWNDQLWASIYFEDRHEDYDNLQDYVAWKIGDGLQIMQATAAKSGYKHGTPKEAVDKNGCFSQAKFSAIQVPSYCLWYGTYLIWYGWIPVFFTREQLPQHARGWEHTCMWTLRGVHKKLKKLHQEIRIWAVKNSEGTIRVWTPEERGCITAWKPGRPFRIRSEATIVLPDGVLNSVLEDMNKFLLPDTQEHFARLGQPHRRGYLFYGPPGTGKTSLSQIAAGKYGLDIYHINLDGFTGDIMGAVKFLPQHCILLLEDIDKMDFHAKGEEKTLSLSAVLNALDGVGAAEGRVVIMTCNQPEKLDSALTRPGRIDFKQGFSLATRRETEQLFLNCYKPLEREPPKSPSPNPKTEKRAPDVSVDPYNVEGRGYNDEELSAYVQRFCNIIPDKELPAAAIISLLVQYPNNPKMAVDNAAEYVRQYKEFQKLTSPDREVQKEEEDEESDK